MFPKISNKPPHTDRHLESYFNDLIVYPLPNDAAILDGIITLTGGQDFDGRPLIVFPMEMHLKIQMLQISQPQILNGLIYYYQKLGISENSLGLAFLVDFRAGSVIIVEVILNAITEFQKMHSQCRCVFYGIKPQDSILTNHIKKILNIKAPTTLKKMFRSSSKTTTTSGAIKTVLVKSSLDLYNYINQRYLTYEFGGQLQYSHETWLLLEKDVQGYINKICLFKNLLPEIDEKILKFREYKNSSSDKVTFRLQMLYDDIIKKTDIHQLIKEANSLLFEISLPASNKNSKYQILKQNPHLDNKQMLISAIKLELKEIEHQLQDTFTDVKNKFNLKDDLTKIKEVARDEVFWIQKIGIPYLKSNPKISLSADEAESVSRKFHNFIYIPGMKCISKCEEITTFASKTIQTNNVNSQDVGPWEKIIDILHLFNCDLQERRKLYTDIYLFHKVLSQVTAWLRKTLTNLPIEFLEYNENLNPYDIVTFKERWENKIKEYKEKNPLLKVAQIDFIEKISTIFDDENKRDESQLAVFKGRTLLRFFSCVNVTVEDIKKIIDWKYQLKLDSHEDKIIDNRMNIQTLQLKTFHNSKKSTKGNQERMNNKNIFQKSEREKIVQLDNQDKKIHFIDQMDSFITKESQRSIFRSQPALNTDMKEELNKKYGKSNTELIELAERTVKESLLSAHLTSQREMRIHKSNNDEDELTQILNQLLNDLNASPDSNNESSN